MSAPPRLVCLTAVENNYDIAQFDEAEFFTINGAKVEIRTDPVTGAEIPR